MKSKVNKIIVVIFICIFFLVACKKEKEEKNHIRIGFSAASETFLLERWDRDIKIFTNAARELGAEVLFAKSPGSALGQISQIQNLVKQDIDVLVVIPQNMNLLSGIIKRIMDKGLPVLCYDRPIMGVPVTGYISFDNREVGRLLASALVSKVPYGDYIILNGAVSDNNSYEVNKGVHEVLRTYVESEDIRIVEEIWLASWSFDEARNKLRPVLEKNPDVVAISGGNDQLAGAAVSLLSEMRLAGDVAVVGQDADLLACQRLAEGLQLMTVYKPIPRLAERAAHIAVLMARGSLPVPNQHLDNDSGQEIPYYVEKPIAVFKDDLENTVIADGFHSFEDIYR